MNLRPISPISVVESARAFIAIDLPTDVKDAVGKVITELAAQAQQGGVRWVKPAQMHLTLNFLGDTPLAQLAAVQSALDGVTSRHNPFVLRLGRINCFPNCHRPRVIWVGLETGGQEGEQTGDSSLPRLKRALDEALRPLGWEPDKRPFRAHLTLGRVKDSSLVRGLSWTADVPPLAIPVTAIHLIQSDLRSDGPIYTIRHTSFLDKVRG